MRRLLYILIALAACGDDSNRHIIDAPMQIVDGPDQDVAPQPVSLTVLQDGVGVANIVVYFQNADSHLVSATHTDATGVATAVVSPNAFVTAIDPFPPVLFGKGGDSLYTFAGVKPGDHLVLKNNNPPFSQITINLTLPSSGNANVTQYSVTMTCQDAMYPVARYSVVAGSAAAAIGGSLSLYYCTAPVDVIVAAETADGQPVETLVKTNQTFTDQQAVDWGGEAYTTAAPRAYTYNNVPSLQDFHVLELTSSTLGSVYASYGGAFTYDMPTTTGVGAVPDIAGTGVLDTDIQTDTYALHHFIDWGPYSPTFTTDVTARMLHQFTGIPTVTLNSLTWTEDTVGGAPDFAIGQLFNYRPTDSRSWRWQFVAPYTAGVLALPTLPTDVYDFNIAATDSASFDGLSFAKLPGGYDAIRANVFNLESPLDITHVTTTGTAVVEDASYFAPPAFQSRHASALFQPKHLVQKQANVLRHRYR